MSDYQLELKFNKDLLWESDWNGYEVGHEDVPVVGLYHIAETNIYLYIDMENLKVVDGFVDNDL